MPYWRYSGPPPPTVIWYSIASLVVEGLLLGWCVISLIPRSSFSHYLHFTRFLQFYSVCGQYRLPEMCLGQEKAFLLGGSIPPLAVANLEVLW